MGVIFFSEGRLVGALSGVRGVDVGDCSSGVASAVGFGVSVRKKVANLTFDGEVFEALFAVRAFAAAW